MQDARATLTAVDDVQAIHDGTALYTATPEIEQLLQAVGWPSCGGRLIDPGCGDGNMLVAAIRALKPAPGDVDAAGRVRGVEFHAPSAKTARVRVRALLEEFGWTSAMARDVADDCIMTRDFLLTPPVGRWDVMLANPPYWRRGNLPSAYADAMDAALPRHACGDLLHAYLHVMLEHLADGGRMALITSDRWLLNSGAAGIRREMGRTLGVREVRRLDARSAFHRPKERSRGTPPRVHAVSLVLEPGGMPLNGNPYDVDPVPTVEGVPLTELVDLRLAPWLGPDGTFTVGPDSGLPSGHLVPCVEPEDICPRTDMIRATRRWAILTDDAEPPMAVMEHLDANLHRMPPRGRRRVRWLPPERFDGRLPLTEEAILVPRIAKTLRAIRLPPGHLPTNHSLVVASGLPAAAIKDILDDPRVRAQADAYALRLESGHRSYTATVLRRIIVPYDLIERERRAA